MYLQIARQVLAAIAGGAIPEGERLPSVRALAHKLGVNKVTVVSAYRELARRGAVVRHVGSGTFVSGGASGVVESFDRPEMDVPPGAIDLATAAAPPGLFPVAEFQAAINHVIERDGAGAFDYGQVQGYGPLREAVAGYLADRDIDVSGTDVHVVSGAQQGLDLLSKVLLAPGDAALVERPGYPGARACFEARGCRVLDLEVGPQGPDPCLLRRVVKTERPRVIYVNPDFQNPTGATYTAGVRRELVVLAREQDAYVIEDDFSGELYYDQEPLPPVRAIDGGHRVIYMKSVSALSLPGLRLAFLVVPPPLSAAVTRAKYLADITSGGLIQRAFDWFLRDGGWHRHVLEVRQTLRGRYRLAVDRLAALAPAARFEPPGGGLNLWLELASGRGAGELERSARERGLLLLPGGMFGAGDSHVRISFASPGEEELAAGIYILSRLITDLPQSSGRATRRPVV